MIKMAIHNLDKSSGSLKAGKFVSIFILFYNNESFETRLQYWLDRAFILPTYIITSYFLLSIKHGEKGLKMAYVGCGLTI